MDNYLSHRWPAEAGGRSLPKLPAHRRSRPGVLQVIFLVMGIVVLIALLVSIGFLIFRVMLAARISAPPYAADPGGSGQPAASSPSDRWTPEDLPWAAPDPAIQLTLDQSGGGALDASAIYEKALPGVVSIAAQQPNGYSFGTGFIVERSGYLLTNYHVIDDGTALEVMLLSDNTRYDARVVGFDEEFDLAVLKIDGRDLPVLPLGDSDELKTGSQIYAIGNPMGNLYGSMSEGIVSALGREGEDVPNGLAMIQISAPLNTGNSGGPLLNGRGQVVGIVSAKITGIENDTVIEGLGLAIPTTDLLPFVNRILASGESWRPSIGISCLVSSVGDRTGILVREITASTAYEAGLRVNDLIIAANGQDTPTLAALRRVLYTAGADGTVTCSVLRDGEVLEIALPLIDTLGRTPAP